eukprot:TRINITY_DN2115_c0_g1_i1.p1 TRINITY_DN2115_c0_g1~~TRINITY_DN2115_c0_g1_i1.p1  ORF type:complete len:398 (+),score=91.18 TRINITY_DN2115_c0_g1_i1:86-1279(+)
MALLNEDITIDDVQGGLWNLERQLGTLDDFVDLDPYACENILELQDRRFARILSLDIYLDTRVRAPSWRPTIVPPFEEIPEPTPMMVPAYKPSPSSPNPSRITSEQHSTEETSRYLQEKRDRLKALFDQQSSLQSSTSPTSSVTSKIRSMFNSPSRRSQTLGRITIDGLESPSRMGWDSESELSNQSTSYQPRTLIRSTSEQERPFDDMVDASQKRERSGSVALKPYNPMSSNRNFSAESLKKIERIQQKLSDLKVLDKKSHSIAIRPSHRHSLPNFEEDPNQVKSLYESESPANPPHTHTRSISVDNRSVSMVHMNGENGLNSKDQLEEEMSPASKSFRRSISGLQTNVDQRKKNQSIDIILANLATKRKDQDRINEILRRTSISADTPPVLEEFS